MLSLGNAFSISDHTHQRCTQREIHPNPGGSKEFLTAAERRHRRNCGHSSDPPEGCSSVLVNDPERHSEEGKTERSKTYVQINHIGLSMGTAYERPGST